MKRLKKVEKKGPIGPFFCITGKYYSNIKHHLEQLYRHRLIHR